ncbi:major facilitator superfamily domain-containing protein [Hysterangium stoloniferum]|nr:major facilitator superfamily domain-containing protein [Hysterangium stoloniferum]
MARPAKSEISTKTTTASPIDLFQGETPPSHVSGESTSEIPAIERSTSGDGVAPSNIVSKEDEEERLELAERAQRPIHRRPSPWWILSTIFLASVVGSTTWAPRIDIYTRLACEALQTESETLSIYETTNWMWRKLPLPSKSCSQDAGIQASVAGFITVMTVASGFLTCVTAGWWGQLSDRIGRTRVMAISSIGILVGDLSFIFVPQATGLLPGGYRFLVVGPVISGLLGGMTTAFSTGHAYVSDTTSPETRSRNFALNIGLVMCGAAFGPAFGSSLIRATGDLLSVFYIALITHVLFIMLVAFVIPESLTKSSMRKARNRREALQQVDNATNKIASNQPRWAVVKWRSSVLFGKLLVPLKPLAIFAPHIRADGKGKDYNLLFLVLAVCTHSLVFGVHALKFQYVQKMFGWDSSTTGYWLTAVSSIRSIYLVLILPTIIQLFKPKAAQPVRVLISEEEPLHSEAMETTPLIRSPSRARAASSHVATFDYKLTLTALIIEFTSYIAVCFSSTAPQFTVATMIGGFGAGFGPAVKSVALALYEQGPQQGLETGRLFGALSVAEAASNQIIGPALLGFIYIMTVDQFPKGFLVATTILIGCAIALMLLIRLSPQPRKVATDREEAAVQ